MTCYSLFGNVSHAKVYPGVLNISLSISIVQSIDISKFSVCHFHYITCVEKLLNKKLGLKPMSSEWTAAVLPLTQKPKSIMYIKSISGQKKLQNLDI